jgi:hypothetical protein
MHRDAVELRLGVVLHVVVLRVFTFIRRHVTRTAVRAVFVARSCLISSGNSPEGIATRRRQLFEPAVCRGIDVIGERSLALGSALLQSGAAYTAFGDNTASTEALQPCREGPAQVKQPPAGNTRHGARGTKSRACLHIDLWTRSAVYFQVPGK